MALEAGLPAVVEALFQPANQQTPAPGQLIEYRRGATTSAGRGRACHVSPPSSDDAATLANEEDEEAPKGSTATVPVAQHVENVTQSTCVGPLQTTPKPCGSLPVCQVAPPSALVNTAPRVIPPVTVWVGVAAITTQRSPAQLTDCGTSPLGKCAIFHVRPPSVVEAICALSVPPT
jgi:hypothetical protein